MGRPRQGGPFIFFSPFTTPAFPSESYVRTSRLWCRIRGSRNSLE